MLGAGVARGEEHDLGDGCFFAALKEFGGAEVEEFDLPILAADKDIGGLKIAVDDQVLMGVFDRRTDIDEEADSVADGESAVIAILIEGDAIDVFGDEVRLPGRGDAAIEEPDDVGVLHLRQELALDEEAGFEVVGGEVLCQDLYGHLLGEDAIVALGQIDTAHATAAQ